MDDLEPVERPQLTLTVLDEKLAICRLDRDAPIPDWACQGHFCSITRTSHELSVVCQIARVPAGVESDPDWRVISSDGPLGFTVTGLVETLAEPLATAGISIFFISTYHTDYLMVKEQELPIALIALKKAGHQVLNASPR